MANLATINNNLLADSGIDPIDLIVGTGTVNYIPKFSAEGTIANSQIFDNGTNVGISTNNPLAKLHIVYAGDDNPGIRLQGDATDTNLEFRTNNSYASIQAYDSGFVTAGNLSINSLGGNVAIGKNQALTKLEIAASNNLLGENNTLRFTDTDTATEANQQIGKIEFYSGDTSTPGAGVKAYIGAFASDSTPDAYIAFATQDGSVVSTPVIRALITSTGNLLVGQTTDDVNYLFQLNGVSRSKGEALLGNFPNLTDFGQVGIYATNVGWTDGFGTLVISGRHDEQRPILFTTYNGTSVGERVRIAPSGVLRLTSYGSGSITGTPTYRLAVDSVGNIIEVTDGGGTITGGGTAGQVAFFNGSSSIASEANFTWDSLNNVLTTDNGRVEFRGVQQDAVQSILTLAANNAAGQSKGLYIRLIAGGTPEWQFITGAVSTDAGIKIIPNGSNGLTVPFGTTAASFSNSLTVGDDLTVTDKVGIGGSVGTDQLFIYNAMAKIPTSSGWGVVVQDTNTDGLAGRGGAIAFGAYRTDSGRFNAAAVAGAKSNSTGGNEDGDLLLYSSVASSLTERVRVLSAGRTLMGPTMPTDDGSSALQVSGGNIRANEQVVTYRRFVARFNDTGNLCAELYEDGASTNGGTLALYGKASGTVDTVISAAPTKLNYINNAANVMIGWNTDQGYKLAVNGGGWINGDLQVGSSSVTSVSFRISRTNAAIPADANYFVPTANTPVQSWIEGGYWTGELTGQVTAPNSGYPYIETWAGDGTNTSKNFGFVNKTSGAFTSVDLLTALSLKRTGQVRFPQYGSGSFTGTRAYDLAIDSSGNIIEVAVGAGTITGSGTSGQVTYWNGSSSVTGSTAFTFSPNGQFYVAPTNTAGSGTAFGMDLNPTLVAAANGNTLASLLVRATFTNGGYTGVQNYLIIAEASNNRWFRYNEEGWFKKNDNANATALILENTYGEGYGVAMNYTLGYGGSGTAVGTAITGARIQAIPEGTWSSTASTQDAKLQVLTAQNGVLGAVVTFTSDKYSIFEGIVQAAGDFQLLGANPRIDYPSGSSLRLYQTGSGTKLDIAAGGDVTITNDLIVSGGKAAIGAATQAGIALYIKGNGVDSPLLKMQGFANTTAMLGDTTTGTTDVGNLWLYNNGTLNIRLDTSAISYIASNQFAIGATTSSNALFRVTTSTNDATYSAKIQAVFGPLDYQDSDAVNVWGGGVSETQFTNGATNRPAMLSLGGNLSTDEGMGVINFFRSGNTDGYKSRVMVAGVVQSGGLSNQHGGYFEVRTANHGETNPGARMRVHRYGNTELLYTETAGSTYGFLYSKDSMHVSYNAYYNGNWYYSKTAAASQIIADNTPNILFRVAVSGPIDNAITWQNKMDIRGTDRTDVLIGNASATNSTAGRGNVVINGTSTAILNLTIGGSEKGYLYHNNAAMQLYNVADGDIEVGANNTLIATFKAATSGQRNLVIGGTTALSTSANRANITINGNSNSILAFGVSNVLKGYLYNNGTSFYMNMGAGDMIFEGNTATPLYLNQNGFVGIRTTPLYQLSVNGSNNGIDFETNTTSTYARSIFFTTRETGVAREIGTTGGYSYGPSNPLTMVLTQTSDTPIAMFRASDDTVGAGLKGYKSRGTVALPVSVNNGDTIFSVEGWAFHGSGPNHAKFGAGMRFVKDDGFGTANTYAPQRIEFYNANTTTSLQTNMAIFPNGNTTIGTATYYGSYKLYVEGIVASNSGFLINSGQYNSAADVPYTGIFMTGSSSSDGFGALLISSRTDTSRPIVFGTYNGSALGERARITGVGEFWLGYTSDQGSYLLQVNGSTYSASGFFESSDIRLKTIINRHHSADFDAIEYNWNDGRDSKLHWGYAAQEVMKFLPDAVSGSEELFYTLDYNQVHTYKIAMLEKRIAELESQLKNK
jgi:hypothetical protein